MGSRMAGQPGMQRIGWVDTAKGLAIILVAVHHAVLLLLASGLVDEVWVLANKLFQTFRMPLFFLMAGLFAGSAIARPWRELWRTKLALLVWAYLLWGIVRFCYFLAFPSHRDPSEGDPLTLLLLPIWPTTGLWFLHALVLFLVVAKLLANLVPASIQLAAAGVISALAFAFPVITNVGYSGAVTYFVFFLGGCYGRDLVLRYGRMIRTWHMAALGALFVAISLAVALSGVHRLALFPLAFLALAFGVALSVRLADVRGFGWIGALGRQTLGIYVAHVILIAALIEIAFLVRANDWPAFAWYSPVIMTILAIAASILLRRAAQGTVLDYFYTVPEWFAGRRCRTANGRQESIDPHPPQTG